MAEHGTGAVKGETRIEEPQRWERAVARRSAESRATVPDFEAEVSVRLDAALTQASEWECSVGAIVLRACALALREVPRANAAYRDGRFELYSRINVGLVVAGEDIYAIPTIFDADRLTPGEVDEEGRRLRAAIRAGTLASPELGGATFTFWDAGALGLTRATPLVVPPQAAAVALGAARTGNCAAITLGCDHRVLYGGQAAQFLNEIKRRVEEVSL